MYFFLNNYTYFYLTGFFSDKFSVLFSMIFGHCPISPLLILTATFLTQDKAVQERVIFIVLIVSLSQLKKYIFIFILFSFLVKALGLNSVVLTWLCFFLGLPGGLAPLTSLIEQCHLLAAFISWMISRQLPLSFCSGSGSQSLLENPFWFSLAFHCV